MHNKDFIIQFEILEDYFDKNHSKETTKEYWNAFKDMPLNRFALICKKLRDGFKTFSHRRFPLIGDFHDINREIVNSQPVELPKYDDVDATVEENKAYVSVIMEIYNWVEAKLSDYNTIFEHFKNNLPPANRDWEKYCNDYRKKLMDARHKRQLEKIKNEAK